MSYIQLPLKGLAIASLLTAIAAITTLVIVVSVTGADALSTLAITLAVLAFVVQIMVYIVQSSETSAESRRSQQLHAQVVALLSEIQARTSGTQQSMDTINVRLLEAVIGKTTISGGEAGTPEFASAVATAFSAEIASRRRPSNTEDRDEPVPITLESEIWPPHLELREAARLHAIMTSWPEVLDKVVSAKLIAMKPSEVMSVYRYAIDLVRFSEPNANFGPGLNISSRIQASMMEKVNGWKLYRLSPEGMEIGRLLTAPEPAPLGFEVILPTRREAISKYMESSVRSNRDVD